MSTSLTEQEAKSKWCPMVRQLGTLIGRRDVTQDDRTIAMGSQNRGHTMGGPLDNCLCIASGCMMWRWDADTEFFNRSDVEFHRTGRRIPPEKGYCGLADRPVVIT